MSRYKFIQEESGSPDLHELNAVAEHLAWRYGLALDHSESGRQVLRNHSTDAEVDPLDPELMCIQKWLRSPLQRDYGDPRGTLHCPMDDLEQSWLTKRSLNSVPAGLPDTFQIWLSHDIDQLRMSYQVLTWTLARAMRGQWKDASDIATNWLRARLKGSDVFWNLDRLLRVEKEFGVRATYFFLHQRPLGSWNEVDSFPLRFGLYSIAHPRVQKLIGEVHREGGEVALHGSLGSARSAAWFEEELRLISDCAVPRPNVSRQHWLDFELWKTVEILERAGVRLDSSIGFNAPGWGFRMRTAWPHRLPAPQLDKLTKVVHVTPAFQDGAMHEDWQLQLGRLLKFAADRKATLSVVWHNTAWQRSRFAERAYMWFIERALAMGAKFVVGADLLRIFGAESGPKKIERASVS